MSDPSTDGLEAEVARLEEQIAGHVAQQAAHASAARNAANRLNLLESVMETVPVGVVLADAKGRIIHGNSHVEQMVRHPVLHSQDVDSYGEWVSFHEDGRRVESHEYPLSRVIRDGEQRAEIDVNYRRGDGTLFWMRIIGKPVYDGAGALIGATVALIDIDEERRLKQAQDILIAELDHRVKNAFAVVKSIVGRSLQRVDVPERLRRTIDERLDAYAKAHAKLVGSVWDRAPIGEIARDVVGPIASDGIRIDGPVVELPSRQALALSMAFYELATNAVKHGALSASEGKVDLVWTVQTENEGERIVVTWTERSGPLVVEPETTGFGSLITGRALAMETDGTVHSAFLPDGLVWTLDMPAPIAAEKDRA